MRSNSTPSEEFGLYLHIPYCRTICPYCDFNVYQSNCIPWNELSAAMIRNAWAYQEMFHGRVLSTLYLGGGTPSLASPDWVQSLLEGLAEIMPFSSGLEITLEANPGTLSEDKLVGYRLAGINRLSLGWQSSRSSQLHILGRDHDGFESRESFEMARKVGFDNVNIDLIFGVPGQALKDLGHDLAEIEVLCPEHVSLYELTFHEGTPFASFLKRGRMTRMDEELLLAMTEEIEGRLSLSGYEHYEVSNFAQPGRRSKHNSSYWNGVPYLGLGPGAHSFFVVKGQSGKRWENLRRPEKYIEAWAGSTTGIVAYEAETFPGVSWVESLTPQQLLQERMMTGLRCANGVDLDRLWKEGWGRPELCRIEMAIKKGWLIKSGSLVQPTKEGMKLADSLAALFF